MKHLFVSLLLLSAATFALAADDATLQGKWNVHLSVMGNESDQQCSFTVKGSEVGGECIQGQRTWPVTGKVEGKTITWQHNGEYNGDSLTITYTGKLVAADKFSGTLTVAPFGVGGDFTAAPAK